MITLGFIGAGLCFGFAAVVNSKQKNENKAVTSALSMAAVFSISMGACQLLF